MRTLLRLIKGKPPLLVKHLESEFCLWPLVWLSVLVQRLRRYILLSPTLMLTWFWGCQSSGLKTTTQDGWFTWRHAMEVGGIIVPWRRWCLLEAPPLTYLLTELLICITARPVHLSALDLRRNTFSLSFGYRLKALVCFLWHSELLPSSSQLLLSTAPWRWTWTSFNFNSKCMICLFCLFPPFSCWYLKLTCSTGFFQTLIQ